jgi:hypothetical protein
MVFEFSILVGIMWQTLIVALLTVVIPPTSGRALFAHLTTKGWYASAAMKASFLVAVGGWALGGLATYALYSHYFVIQ